MTDQTDLPHWGAIPLPEGKTRFRLWAPDVDSLSLRLNGADHVMEAEPDGWFSLSTAAAPRYTYAFVLPDGRAIPDPASRAQQGDVHGPSLVVDPSVYAWQTDWRGRPWEEAVIYELHTGTFTPDGTFRSAMERLPHIAETGFTAVELMPVAQFAGTRGWGYDGVLLYAPHSVYGSPDDLRAFVDAAHAHGLMVLLDVVYNHFGPVGNHLPDYAGAFFHPEVVTPWGEAIAFDAAPVRRFFIDNALHWLREYRLDGLRLDAIDFIDDPSEPEIVVEIAQEIRTAVADRPVHLTTEDDRNITRLHERGPENSVPLYTAEWNDDLHNVVHAIVTGETDGYYVNYMEGRWEMLGRALATGYGFQGQTMPATGKARGQTSDHLPPVAFIDFLQNHDQIGNRAFGERLSALAPAWRVEAMTAILLLSPHIPLMFMGEEWAEDRPFCFFAEFEGEQRVKVTEGRRREFAQFDAFAETGTHHVPDPCDPATFEASRLDWSQAQSEQGRAAILRIRDLLSLRREHIVPHLAGTGGGSGRVLLARQGALAIDWRLGGSDGVLVQLRANLSDSAQDLPPALGDMLHCVRDPLHGVAETAGAPRSVLHFIAEA